MNAISTMDWKEVITSVEASRKLLNSLWDMDEETVAEGIDKAHREISIVRYIPFAVFILIGMITYLIGVWRLK